MNGDHRGAFVLPFDLIGAPDLPLVGGKGANLGEMARAGFPVPPGFCVTTRAFDRFLGQVDPATGAPVADALYAALGGLGSDLAELRRVAASLRAQLESLPIPAPVEEAVLAAWEAAGADAAYAVRSSATAEDLPQASFAGQQDTYLNVRGPEALLDAVRRCWASLFTDRAIVYRAENGFEHRAVRLSVVVQRMVFPEKAGILFTADPLTGHRRIVSIDAGFGLGEALVSGIVSADLYRVETAPPPADAARLIEVRVGDKPLAIVPLPGGGTERRALPEAERSARVLSDAEALALARLGRRVAEHYGRPQDIEWCIDAAGAITLVQSRPITTLFPLPDPAPGDPGLHLYLSFNHVQVMTDPISPMGRSVLRMAIPFGKPEPLAENPFLTEAGGRLYADMTPLLRFEPLRRRAPRLLRFADALMAEALAELVERPDFRAAQGLEPRLRARDLAHWLLPILLRAQPWLWWRRPETGVQKVEAICESELERLRARIEAAPPGLPRVLEARQAVAGLFRYVIPRLPPFLVAGMLARQILFRLSGDPAAVDDLLRGLVGNVTTEMDLQTADLADLASRHPAVAEAIRADPTVAVLSRLEGIQGGPEFLAAWRAFLDRFGMRGPSEIDIGRPRWREDPAPLLRVVASGLQREAEGLHRAQLARQTALGEAAVERLVAAQAPGPTAFLRRRLVRRLARVVRGLLAMREHPKFLMIRVLWLVKQAIRDSAAGLAREGRLAGAEDVWLLSLSELIEALEGPAPGTGERVAARRAEQARFAQLRPPRILTSEGESPEVHPPRAGLPAGALGGSAASAGRVEGVARVVLDPTRDSLAPGEILVAPFTDPGWTPLFVHAAGLVMEVGGLMTHGSVVAREYGIPAVVGVPDATRRIQSGQRIRVNGDGGFVEILDPEEGPAPTV